MSKHLKICNAKKLMDSNSKYLVNGINSGDGAEWKPIALSEFNRETIDAVIRKVEIAYGMDSWKLLMKIT